MAPQTPETSDSGNFSLQNFDNDIPSNYDRYTGGASITLARSMLSMLTPICPITQDSYVLDNACGTGVVAALINSSFYKEHREDLSKSPPEIFCTDHLSTMLNIVSENMRQNDWDNVETGQADIRNLSVRLDDGEPPKKSGLEDESFTHVLTNLGFCSVSGTGTGLSGVQKAMDECYRVLKYGGVCGVSTWAGKFSLVFFTSFSFLFPSLSIPHDSIITFNAVGISNTDFHPDRQFAKAFWAASVHFNRRCKSASAMYFHDDILYEDAQKASWLIRLFEEAGFSPAEGPDVGNADPGENLQHYYGPKIKLESVEAFMEAENVDMLTDIMLRSKHHFFTGCYYQGEGSEEKEVFKSLLQAELQKLDGYEVLEGGRVRVRMLGWVAVATKFTPLAVRKEIQKNLSGNT